MPSIDSILHGGLLLHRLTEISGEAGSGKSQLVFHLCLTAQFPKQLGGLQKKTLYINTEGPFTTERVLAMARHLIKRHNLDTTATELLENFIYISVFDYEELLQLLKVRLPRLLEMEPIGLVVIDSVAAVFRTHCNYIDRAKNMRSLVYMLERLGKINDFGVVCVNQVRTNPNSMEIDVAPALGLAWANLVSTRIQLYKEESVVKDGAIMQKRTLRVIWAPNVPPNEATFYMSGEGIS